MGYEIILLDFPFDKKLRHETCWKKSEIYKKYTLLAEDVLCDVLTKWSMQIKCHKNGSTDSLYSRNNSIYL